MLDDKTIFLIGGKKFAGKTTLGHMLALQIDAALIEISNPIVKAAYQLGWDGQKDAKGRPLLQQIGMLGRKFVSEYFHVEAAIQCALESRYLHVVVCGIRLDNEIECFKKISDGKVIVIKVVRPAYNDDNDKHITERGISDDVCDYRVINGGSKEDLFSNMMNIVRGEVI